MYECSGVGFARVDPAGQMRSERRDPVAGRSVVELACTRRAGSAAAFQVLTPAGSEKWFEEIASLQPEDRDGFDDACRRHGIRFDHSSPWTDEIRKRFGL